MPRLPDFTALGQRDTGPSRRPIATIDTSAESNAIAGFGRSISGAADVVFRAAENDKAQDLQINGARADADFLTKKIEFEKQFNDEDQDYANWSPRYQEGIKKIAEVRRPKSLILAPVNCGRSSGRTTLRAARLVLNIRPRLARMTITARRALKLSKT